VIEARLIAEEASAKLHLARVLFLQIVKSVFIRLPDFDGCMRDGAAVRIRHTAVHPDLLSGAVIGD